jgi:hypothetical protein
MPFLDWTIIPRSTQLVSLITLPLVSAKGETIIKWKAFSKLWCCCNKNNPGNETQECNLNKVFANHCKEEEIFPLTTPEIAEAQKADIKLKHCFRRNPVLDKGLED